MAILRAERSFKILSNSLKISFLISICSHYHVQFNCLLKSDFDSSSCTENSWHERWHQQKVRKVVTVACNGANLGNAAARCWGVVRLQFPE